MWVFIGMIPLSLLYLIKPFQRLIYWHKSLAHVCFVLQIIHCNICGFSISIGNLSLTIKNPQQIELPLCGFQVATLACITTCYITVNRICCNNRMNCRNLHIGVFTIGIPKKNDLVFKGQQKTTLDICLSYIIIVVVDCCMPIDKMMFC
jgi:hypothetical protein